MGEICCLVEVGLVNIPGLARLVVGLKVVDLPSADIVELVSSSEIR